MKIEWEKIVSEYERTHPPDFITHLNYVSFLNMLSQNLKVKCNLVIKNKIKESKKLAKKINLVKLTLKSIEGEYKTILKNPDYAELCVSWISVKTYYLIFNLLLILDYFLTAQESSFDLTHQELIKRFKNYLSQKQLIFNKSVFNGNYPCLKIIRLRVKPGSNIKIINYSLKERFIQILKKLIDYKLEDFRRKERIKNFKSKESREKKKKFLKSNTVNIFEFFYWYRIKANYRDLEFLNKEISSKQFSDFYKNYFELTINFLKALIPLLNNLSKTRIGKILFEI